MSSGSKLIDFFIPGLAGNSDDAQAADLIIHLGIMNDFAEQKNRLVRVSPARRIGQVNGAFDAVTKAKFLGEFDGQITCGKDVPVGANAFDQFAAVMRQDLRLHGGHDIRPAQD